MKQLLAIAFISAAALSLPGASADAEEESRRPETLVSISFNDADPVSALLAIARIGGVSIVFDTGVGDKGGRVSAFLTDVPVMTALDSVARAAGLQVVVEAGACRVSS